MHGLGHKTQDFALSGALADKCVDAAVSSQKDSGRNDMTIFEEKRMTV